MLKVINTKTRDRVQLTGLWDFCLDPDDVGEKEAWFAHFLPEAVKMAVPSSFNDIFTQNSICLLYTSQYSVGPYTRQAVSQLYGVRQM